MKKLPIFLTGALVGAVVMTAGSALADGIKSLVNEKVGSVWELNVNGEAVGEVPIIKGSSYAPVRQIADIAGLDVDFEPGKVYLTTKEGGGLGQVVDKEYTSLQVAFWERQIDKLKELRAQKVEEKAELTTSEANASMDEAIAELDARITEYEAEIVKLEAELKAAK